METKTQGSESYLAGSLIWSELNKLNFTLSNVFIRTDGLVKSSAEKCLRPKPPIQIYIHGAMSVKYHVKVFHSYFLFLKDAGHDYKYKNNA